MLPFVKQLNSKRIVLASSSPRRKELLQTVVSNKIQFVPFHKNQRIREMYGIYFFETGFEG